jgi:cytochrome P450
VVLLHRDGPAAPYGDAFVPDIWLDGRAAANPALVPFSAGPGACPGENVVLRTASTWLAELLRDRAYALVSRVRPAPPRPLPATLGHFAPRFAVWRPAAGELRDSDTGPHHTGRDTEEPKNTGEPAEGETP